MVMMTVMWPDLGELRCVLLLIPLDTPRSLLFFCCITINKSICPPHKAKHIYYLADDNDDEETVHRRRIILCARSDCSRNPSGVLFSKQSGLPAPAQNWPDNLLRNFHARRASAGHKYEAHLYTPHILLGQSKGRPLRSVIHVHTECPTIDITRIHLCTVAPHPCPVEIFVTQHVYIRAGDIFESRLVCDIETLR